MQEYYFLFGLGFVWLCFAVVQDLRTREISNWLNFSLLGLALFYRGFVAFDSGKAQFFWWGVAGTFFFVALGYLLYYGRAFAGGDAKLLMALGPLIPFERFNDLVVLGLGFVFVLFLGGSIYSLIYTAAYIPSRWKPFSNCFAARWKSSRFFMYLCFVLGVVIGLSMALLDVVAGLLFLAAFALLPFLYLYGKTVESCFFIKRVLPSKLAEGDWLVRDVSAGAQVIRARVHGLTLKEIAMLRKAKKSVTIKEGIPFSPAFLLAFLAMVFYVLR
ncbi:MAG: A24 family peptidase [Nanoarchaeota archaeon]